MGRLNGKQGVIINISSTVCDHAPLLGWPSIRPTKAAVDNITRTLALELGTKARVVSLAPGLTHTEGYADMARATGDAFAEFEALAIARTPLARAGEPDDIAKVATFLASDDAGWYQR